VPDVDSPVVARLKEAGAIPIARTNMPDGGMRWHTDNDLHGPTLNPWDAARSPGGSSGGEAVAIATGMSPIGLGNDYGGSLRLPALAAGIVALRPSFGSVASAWSLEPDGTPTLQLMSVDGPLARCIDDLELAFRLLRVGDRRDPWWMPVIRDDTRSDPSGIRVAVVLDPAGLGTAPEVREGVQRAADALANAGYAVEERDPPDVLLAAQLWRDLTGAELRPMFAELGSIVSQDTMQYQQGHQERVQEIDLDGYMQRFAQRLGLARRWSEFQSQFQLILGPVSTEPIQPVGFDLGGAHNAETLWLRHRLLVSVNLLGLPALAVPAGMSDAGLPLGVQLIGDRYREDLCLQAGREIERALGLQLPIDPRSASPGPQPRGD
jgi:amidase